MLRVENFGFFFAFSMRHVFGILNLFPAVPRSVYGASPYSIGGQIVFHGPFDPNSEGYPRDKKFSTLMNPFGCDFRLAVRIRVCVGPVGLICPLHSQRKRPGSRRIQSGLSAQTRRQSQLQTMLGRYCTCQPQPNWKYPAETDEAQLTHRLVNQ